MNNEELIRMATKLYDARKTAKNIYGSEWKEKIDPFKVAISLKMKADAIDEMSAGIRLSAKACETSAITGILILAAVVDMVEPE